jgi:O-antigen ligase
MSWYRLAMRDLTRTADPTRILVREWRAGAIGWRVAFGAAFLVLAAASVVTLPASWPAVGLATLATIGLAGSRRLGWLGAALLVALALPFGRGADVAPFTVGGLPLRPQDGVIAVSMLGALVGIQWRTASRRPMLVAIGIWLAVGLSALVVGLTDGHGLRDVFRDVRWWTLYAVAAVAILGATRRDQLVRGLLLGCTVLALVVIAATLLPAYTGGLKAMALEYDRGTLRMQFGNSAALVVASGYLAWQALRLRTPAAFAWLGLVVAAQVLSLTRISIIVTLIVVGLVVASQLWADPRLRAPARAVRLVGMVSLVLVLALAGGIQMSIMGIPPPAPGGPATPAGENPLDRITFSDERSGIGTVVGSAGSGGRLATYVNVLVEIRDVPLIGRGMGSLVSVPFAYTEARASTLRRQPGVDNAYLTAALKGGIPGSLAMAGIFLVPLWAARSHRRFQGWYVPAWLGIGALTMTQSFAVSSYGPFVVALLAALPFVGYVASRSSAARAQE